MGRLAGDAEWLERVLGADADEVAAIAADLRAARAAEMLVFARWVLVMTNFERSLYADPDSDLDARWWELVERYQLLAAPSGRSNADWAAKIHVACAPVYYHCYLYGHLVASQLSATLERECGGLVDRPAAGALLRERIFHPGQSVRWDRPARAGDGRAADGDVLRARHRSRLSSRPLLGLSSKCPLLSSVVVRSPLEVPRPARVDRSRCRARTAREQVRVGPEERAVELPAGRRRVGEGARRLRWLRARPGDPCDRRLQRPGGIRRHHEGRGRRATRGDHRRRDRRRHRSSRRRPTPRTASRRC